MITPGTSANTPIMDSLEFYTRPYHSSPESVQKYAPAMIAMSAMQPLPIYYSYCLQRGVINLEYISKHLQDVFNCAVYGEHGTARSSIAFILYHLLMKEQPMPAFRIDCAILDESMFTKIFLSPSSPLQERSCFLFLYELHMMPLDLQKMLCVYLSEHPHKCVASMCSSTDIQIKVGNLLPELASLFKATSYHMPPLRGNPADIVFAADLLLNYYNTECGKHIIGFAPDALETLKKYDWPGNITQLAQLMNALVMQTKEIYISNALVRFYLYESGQKFSSQSFWLHLDLSMTLAAIDRHIVECVLRQENWNQSKAAKRLGISRSTLWRMLQEKQP